MAPFAPQLTLLDRASLFITHAGMNSVLEGLSHGVPMLCIPVANDHPGAARRVERLGAGEALKPGRANATRIIGWIVGRGGRPVELREDANLEKGVMSSTQCWRRSGRARLRA